MNKILGLIVFIGLLTFSCSTDKKSLNEEEVISIGDSPSQNGELPKVSFYQYADSSQIPDAILELYTPLGNQVFKPGKVPFEFNIKNYPYDLEGNPDFKLFNILNGSDPVGFGSPIFQRELTIGSYRIVAYLVDENGLALKNFGNYVDRDFQVGESRPFPYSAEPYLALNYPRNGQIFENGNEVIIDFLVVGGDMKLDGLKVSVAINDFSYEVKEMAPIRIANLPKGEYQVKVRLQRTDGKELEGPFSTVSKSIIVR
jgi:hypothetical protein